MINPYSIKNPHYEIWEMCIRRDLEGFLANDWSVCANDFISEGFMGWDASFSANPMEWKVTYPDLGSYQKSWLKGAQDFQKNDLPDDIREQLYSLVSLIRIEMSDSTAIVHKKFNGQIKFKNQSVQTLAWQSIFNLKKTQGQWRQAGFIGYLPLSLGLNTK